MTNITDRLTPQEVAEQIGVKPQTVVLWIKNGKLPAFKIGSRYYIAKETADGLIKRIN